jgi:hypothetical protein
MLDREPLLTRAGIVSIVAVVVALLGTFGVHLTPQLQDGIVQLLTLLAILGPLVAAYLARKHVTPVADPRADDGTPLVPEATEDAPPAVQ